MELPIVTTKLEIGTQEKSEKTLVPVANDQSVLENESIFTEMAEEYGAEHVVYSHCHGEKRFADSIRGMHHGIHYHLVSGDYLNFKPEKILD